MLSDLNTRVVVPLLPPSIAPKPATRLNPFFEFNDEPVVMVTQFMAAIPTDILKASVGKLTEEFEKVTTAIDIIIQGLQAAYVNPAMIILT